MALLRLVSDSRVFCLHRTGGKRFCSTYRFARILPSADSGFVCRQGTYQGNITRVVNRKTPYYACRCLPAW